MPEFIKLPKAPDREPHTSLSRSRLNQLVLPCKENNYKAPVRSVSLRKRDQKQATRLIDFNSLMEYLYAHSKHEQKEPGG